MDQEICFVVDNQEFKVSQMLIQQRSEKCGEIIEKFKEKGSINIILPQWVPQRSFSCLIKALETNEIQRMDILSCQKFIWLCDYLGISDFDDQIIEQQIIPQLEKDTVLLFIQDTSNKLNSNNYTDGWNKLFYASVDLASKHILYLLSKFNQAFNVIDRSIINQIILKSLTFLDRKDIQSLLSSLVNIYGIDTVFDIYQWILDLQPENDTKSQIKQAHKLENLDSNNFYLELPEFESGGLIWKLIVSYFQHEQRTELAIRQVIDGNKATMPKGTILSTRFSIQISEIDQEKPDFQSVTIITGVASQTQLRVIENHEIQNGQSWNFTIFFEIDNPRSAALSYFVTNAQNCLFNERIECIDIEGMQLISKHNHLNVNNENEVLEIMVMWLSTNNFHPDYAQSIFENLRWQYITAEGLLQLLSKWPKLKACQPFQHYFTREMENKVWFKRSFSRRRANETKPRKPYKESCLEQSFPTPKELVQMFSQHVLLINEDNTDKFMQKIEQLTDEIKTKDNLISSLQQQIKQLEEEKINSEQQIKKLQVSDYESQSNASKTSNLSTKRYAESGVWTRIRESSRSASMDYRFNRSWDFKAIAQPQESKIDQLLSQLRNKVNDRLSANSSNLSDSKSDLSESLLNISKFRRNS